MKKILYSGLESIGDLVQSVVNNSDLNKGLKKSMLFKFWGKIVGKKFEKITNPVSINPKGEMLVACANSMVTSELLMFKNDILKKMAPYTKSLDLNVTDIIFSHKIWKSNVIEEIEEPLQKINLPEFNPDEIELDEDELNAIKKSIENNKFATEEQRGKMLSAIINDLKYQKYKAGL